MRLREATIDDFAFVEEHSMFPDHYQKEPNQITYSVTLEQDNDVVAVGGLILITANTAWAWCDLTTFSEGHTRELVVNMQNWLDMQILDLGLSRLQCWVDENRPEAIKLIRHLGFIEEFKMKDFLGFGRNAIMFIKLTGGE